MEDMLFIVALGFLIYRAIVEIKNTPTSSTVPVPNETGQLVFRGSRLKISKADQHTILSKYHSYYRCLDPLLQKRFLKRLNTFMKERYFIIMDEKGFREMPVLVSATAVQIGFGLENYRLPFYRYIRIFPTEYLSDHSFAILAGNVQNNIITVAWNQFLHGLENESDGSNVGLHEMSHALYMQNLVIDQRFESQFFSQYDLVMQECQEASIMEKEGRNDLYSSYADKNLQEFWAESVEIFFEKPEELYQQYPDVFHSIKAILNQDPRNRERPVE